MKELGRNALIYLHKAPGIDTTSLASICLGVGIPAGVDGARLAVAKSGADLSSCADYVLTHQAEIRAWAEANRLQPDRLFEATVIVVEDASPDTCLSLFMIAALLTGESVPAGWVDAARSWEMGLTPVDPLQSWAAHHSALVHAVFELGDASASVPAALRKGFAYLASLVRVGASPYQLPKHFSDPAADLLHQEATACLEQERISYRNLAAHALTAQLAVRMAGSRKSRLIDAIFFAEEVLHGSAKIFARNDHTSWTGSGFLLSGVYRPGAPNGTDITFSVAPNAGLTLLSLWQKLEEQEWRAWGSDRPSDRPRPLAGYAETEARIMPSNDPWWDGGPSHDLVAAPGKFGTPTRLGWSDALAQVWALYAPGKDLKVRPRLRPDAPFLSAHNSEVAGAREPLGADAGLVVIDLERDAASGDPPVLWCPTLAQSLAALISGGPVSLETLPDPDGFELVRVGSGAVIIAGDGVLLLGPPNDARFAADALRETAARVAATLDTAVRLEAELAEARQCVRGAIPSGRGGDRRDALTRLYAIQLRAREHWPRQDPQRGGAIQTIRAVCELRWHASERFHHVLEEAKELEAMLVSSSESRAGSLLQSLAIYGFPAALFGNVLGAAFGPMTADGSSGWHIAWNAVIWFAGLTAGAAAILFAVSRLTRAQWRRSMERAPSVPIVGKLTNSGFRKR